jgi:hypothetical protein
MPAIAFLANASTGHPFLSFHCFGELATKEWRFHSLARKFDDRNAGSAQLHAQASRVGVNRRLRRAIHGGQGKGTKARPEDTLTMSALVRVLR